MAEINLGEHTVDATNFQEKKKYVRVEIITENTRREEKCTEVREVGTSLTLLVEYHTLLGSTLFARFVKYCLRMTCSG